jgi:hypothetical protein
LVRDLLSQVEVNLIIDTRLLSESSQLSRGSSNFSLGHCDLFNDFDLLLFDVIVFVLEAIKLSDESVHLGPILADLGQALCLNPLLFHLDLFVLLLEIFELLLKCSKVSLSTPEFRNVILKFRDEEFLMLVHLHSSDSNLLFEDGSYTHALLVLVLSSLLANVVSWGFGSVLSGGLSWVVVFLFDDVFNVFSAWEFVFLVHALISSLVILALINLSVLPRSISLIIGLLAKSILSGFALKKMISICVINLLLKVIVLPCFINNLFS